MNICLEKKKKKREFYFPSLGLSLCDFSFLSFVFSLMNNIKPKCSICMQTYSNETFLRPCFHSFCFECICYWINITPESANCPICRQSIQSLVYNVDEENNDFDEYFLKDRQYETHEPPLRRKRTLSPGEKIKLQRKQVYKGLYHQTHYPESLPRHANLTIITPEHIPRVFI